MLLLLSFELLLELVILLDGVVVLLYSFAPPRLPLLRRLVDTVGREGHTLISPVCVLNVRLSLRATLALLLLIRWTRNLVGLLVLVLDTDLLGDAGACGVIVTTTALPTASPAPRC